MKVDCYPISVLPRLSRLFLDYTSSRELLAPFFSATPFTSFFPVPTQDPNLRAAVANLLLEQNRSWHASAASLANIEKLRHGAGAFVTGQQVALFTGPLFTLLKAATVIHRAKLSNSVPIFWLASEDHDLAEADHVTLPTRHALQTLKLYRDSPADPTHSSAQPVGNLPLGPGITTVIERAAELIGGTPEFDLLAACYTPGATFASAFARFLSAVFADHGLVVIDASTRAFHALGAPILRHAIEHAADLESALHDRDQLLAERAYHSQVLVAPGSTLLFLIDQATGNRLPLRRKNGSWFAGKVQHSAADLLAILDTAPERLSPNALLRPVFQDYLLPTQAIIGGPAEIAYYAQNQVLCQAILGRTTPVLPRLSATLIDPAIATILDKDQLSLQDVFAAHPDELAHRLGARSLPVEGKLKLAAAGNALDAELDALLAWSHSLDASLGRAAQVSASKMRYQMNRLRRLAANYQLQRDAGIRRHVDALYFNLFPDRHPQERTIGGAACLSRYGTPLLTTLIEQATPDCPGHKAIWL
ncbi:MAG TPA: bacillithiol biosynthesis cysteine-adding enzyme BshC [Acidobacteriaceae bacterium]|nr:bacillithiol biosynthesis cysteine-adding enzyme BshC [Acidobacteriaceae bacterium]